MHVPSPRAPRGASNPGGVRTVALRLKPTSRRLIVAGVAMAAVAGTAVATLASAAESTTTAPASYSIWPGSTTPANPSENDTASVEVGTRFTTQNSGWVTGVRYYKGAQNTGKKVGKLWDSSGRLLAQVTFSGETGSGWQQAAFSTPVTLKAGSNYTVSYRAPNGRYANDEYVLSASKPKVSYALTAIQGVYTYGTGAPKQTWHDSNYYVDVVFTTVRPGTRPWTDPTPSATSTTTTTTTTAPSPTTTTATAAPSPTTTTSTTSAPSPTTSTTTAAPSPTTTATTTSAPTTSGWPDASNTGWSGTLSPYTGPCTILTANYTIKNADVRAKCGELLIQTTGVTIDNSRLPRVESTYRDGASSVKITNSNVEAGNWVEGAVWGYNITLDRSEVTGGQHSVHANNNVTVTNSWLHSQYNPTGQSYHNNAFITNGGSNMLVRHNTLHCTAILNSTDGGCTADVSLFGDFGPVQNVTIDNNLLKANNSSISYCAYGGYQPAKAYPVATGIKYTNNVFERGANNKCGVYGPVTSFQTTASGNVWSNNTFQDGTLINP